MTSAAAGLCELQDCFTHLVLSAVGCERDLYLGGNNKKEGKKVNLFRKGNETKLLRFTQL